MAMTSRFKLLAVLGLCLPLAVAGCGRKGGLDDPSRPLADTAATPADPALVAPVATPDPESDRPFPLDFLIK